MCTSGSVGQNRASVWTVLGLGPGPAPPQDTPLYSHLPCFLFSSISILFSRRFSSLSFFCLRRFLFSNSSDRTKHSRSAVTVCKICTS